MGFCDLGNVLFLLTFSFSKLNRLYTYVSCTFLCVWYCSFEEILFKRMNRVSTEGKVFSLLGQECKTQNEMRLELKWTWHMCFREEMDYCTKWKCWALPVFQLEDAGACTLKSFTIYFSLACLFHQILNFCTSLPARCGNLKLLNGLPEKPFKRGRLTGHTP